MIRTSYDKGCRQVSKSFGTPTMQKVINRFLNKIPLDKLPTWKKTGYSNYAIFFVLLFAGLTQGAVTWSTQGLQAFGPPSRRSILFIRNLKRSRRTWWPIMWINNYKHYHIGFHACLYSFFLNLILSIELLFRFNYMMQIEKHSEMKSRAKDTVRY